MTQSAQTTGVPAGLLQLLDDVASADLFTDAQEHAQQIGAIRDAARVYREQLKAGTQATVRVAIIAPGAEPMPVVVENDYKTFQGLVGGLLDAVAFAPGLAFYINDEGMLDGLAPNLVTNTGALLCGTLVFHRFDDDGEVIDLTDDDLEQARELVKQSARFVAEYEIPSPGVFFAEDGESWDAMVERARNTHTQRPSLRHLTLVIPEGGE